MSGIGPRPEAGCNCVHLPKGATCFECSRYGSDKQKLIADGGRDDWFSCQCGAEYRNRSAANRCCTPSILRGFLP